MDSTLNDLLQGVDRASDAAHVKRKIFIVWLEGEFCNCLVRRVALAGGAEFLIIDTNKPGTVVDNALQKEISDKVAKLKKMIEMGKTFATIVFFSPHPERGEIIINRIKQAINNAPIDKEATVLPMETSLGGITPTAFDRTLAKRLGEKAMETLQWKMNAGDYSFQLVGIRGKRIVAPRYENVSGKNTRRCFSYIEKELQHCFELMAQPGDSCIGMGGYVQWHNTDSENRWSGTWTCKKCGHSQRFLLNPEKMFCVYCKNPGCHNYGYIRISRRL